MIASLGLSHRELLAFSASRERAGLLIGRLAYRNGQVDERKSVRDTWLGGKAHSDALCPIWRTRSTPFSYVQPGADEDAVKKAYRQLALKW